MRVLASIIVTTLCVLLPPALGETAEVELVAVEDPGNPADVESGGLLGGVPYLYEIGRYEITNAQYAEFLNAVAQMGDPSGLWNPGMEGAPEGGIHRFGSGGAADPYVYETVFLMDNKPVNYVSWEDAAR